MICCMVGTRYEKHRIHRDITIDLKRNVILGFQKLELGVCGCAGSRVAGLRTIFDRIQ